MSPTATLCNSVKQKTFLSFSDVNQAAFSSAWYIQPSAANLFRFCSNYFSFPFLPGDRRANCSTCRNEGIPSGCEGIGLKPEVLGGGRGRWGDILKVLRASSTRVSRNPAEISSTGTNLIIPFPWVLFTRALLFQPSLDSISIKECTWGSVLRCSVNGLLLLFDLRSRCFRDVSKSNELDAVSIHACFPF